MKKNLKNDKTKNNSIVSFIIKIIYTFFVGNYFLFNHMKTNLHYDLTKSSS